MTEIETTRAGQTDTPMVLARQVKKSFHGSLVLKGVDLTVHRGEVVCLIGPSGSGKSTFLRCINNLEQIDGGLLTVDGQHVATAARATGCIR
ncbi:putative amino-acid import ATP-binding protein YxeO [Methylobrevis pamukkalensis]|uniref:Putative amino-acid import ATP-binding protein YxeO n=1 Tax=Methylobrevis pamukkalensis TaxID=1439726 RepID=A0A1E3H4I9_9HYPH|nr:putative amino-acid import ATP-binding protein YxeO [Methylobrevis pamukkalensis]